MTFNEQNKQGQREKEEALFRQLAKSYVEEQGKALKEEAEAIEHTNQKLSSPETERIYQRVQRAQKRKGKSIWGASLAVAGLVLLLMAPQLVNLFAPSAPEYELIALNGELPLGYEIVEVEQDHGQTIYYLAEALGDDVVLVAERFDEAEPPVLRDLGLKESRLGGQRVYGLARQDYNILTFLKDDVQYTLTCQFEMDTLLILGSNIL